MKSLNRRGHYLVDHCRLETRDLDEAREAMDRMWERHRSVLKRGRRYRLRWHQAELRKTALSYGQTSSALHIECGPISDSVHISMHEAGRLKHWVDGHLAVAAPTRGVVHRPGQDLTLETEPFSLLLLTFDGPYVRQCLQPRFEQGSSMAEWPTEFSLTTPSGRTLRALTRWMAGELDQPRSEILMSDCAAQSLERTLLTLFLECLAEQSPADEPHAYHLSEARVRRTEEWIDAHFTDPVGVEDLARVAGVSVRSVQTAFRRLRGRTPMQVVLRRRLEASQDMLSRTAPGTTVTQIAAECGFFNFGRFSRQYQDMFGETPSQTLARRRLSRTG